MANTRIHAKPAACYFTFKVKPHVRKYLRKIYGNRIEVTKRDHIGQMIYFLLKENNRHSKYDKFLSRYTASIEVSISDQFLFKYGARYLTSFSLVQFNNFVESLIKEELYAFVEGCTSLGETVKFAILEFQRKYDFSEDDITYDCLLKAWQRNQTEINNKLSGLCPAA
jgi:hypothetical protein